jgi:FKBP-type peptidyl-prolyl cis-trans isomerase SlpA
MTVDTPVVQADSFLTLHYRLAGPDGTNLVNTFDDKPATLSMGSGELSPGMEEALLGLPEGTRTTLELPDGQAFGPRNPELMQRVALKLLRDMAAPDETWEAGDVVQFPTPNGQGTFAGLLRELDPEGQWALFDFNHPLAGQRVTFEVQLIGVLPA